MYLAVGMVQSGDAVHISRGWGHPRSSPCGAPTQEPVAGGKSQSSGGTYWVLLYGPWA